MAMSPRRIKIVSAIILAAALGVWYCGVQIADELGDEGWGDWRYAVQLIKVRTILAIQQRALGRTHEVPPLTQERLAVSLWNHGKYTKAEKEFRALIATRREISEPEHSEIFRLHGDLIRVLRDKGEIVQAEKEIRALIAAEQHALGAEDPDIVFDRISLGVLLFEQGKHTEAEEEYRAILAIYERIPSVRQVNLALLYGRFALCLEAQGKLVEAFEFIKRAESKELEIPGLEQEAETPVITDRKRIEWKVKAMGLREGAK